MTDENKTFTLNVIEPVMGLKMVTGDPNEPDTESYLGYDDDGLFFLIQEQSGEKYFDKLSNVLKSWSVNDLMIGLTLIEKSEALSWLNLTSLSIANDDIKGKTLLSFLKQHCSAMEKNQ